VRLIVDLSDGRTQSVPLAWCPRFLPGCVVNRKIKHNGHEGHKGLPFQQQPLRILDQLFDLHQKLHRLASVDDAVVVAERHVHHRADDQLLKAMGKVL
jgi:hypothetical protein